MQRVPSCATAKLTFIAALAALALVGCGSDDKLAPGHKTASRTSAVPASPPTQIDLAFPAAATKNTTRIGGADPTENAAAVALAVYPSVVAGTAPKAVTLVDRNSWQASLAAAVLMSWPLRAPILFGEADSLPAATERTLARLHPSGSERVDGAQVIKIGEVATPLQLRTTEVSGSDPFSLAAAIDRLQSAAFGRPSARVIVVSAQQPAFALPAAAWAAKSGDPILFTNRDQLPLATLAALQTHQPARILVLGPTSVIGDSVLKQLRDFGSVTRIGNHSPILNAIAFARFQQEGVGWGVVGPGHGLIFANVARPLDAAAAAALSSSGSYGPLLLTSGRALPEPLAQYLLDIQPGYQQDPVRGVYNHGWLIGDQRAISLADQARIDRMLEITKVKG